jgi:hypothetical protein
MRHREARGLIPELTRSRAGSYGNEARGGNEAGKRQKRALFPKWEKKARMRLRGWQKVE